MPPSIVRERPHWYALVFYYGIGAAVTWQLLEDIYMEKHGLYSDHFYPWNKFVDIEPLHSIEAYSALMSFEVLLLVLYFLRIRPGITAGLLALILFVDNLGSFLNHRLLMSMELFLIALCPVPKRKSGTDLRDKALYWNLDLVRFQLGLVYFVSFLHKLNPQFTSGRTLQNLFWMSREHEVMNYPDWLFSIIQDPTVCLVLAWTTLGVELILAFGLQFRRAVAWILPLAVGFHLSLGSLMPFIWIFTFQIVVSLVVFLPDRTENSGSYRLIRGEGGVGPHRLLRFIVPGYVNVEERAEMGATWKLEMPDGSDRKGIEAWTELLSLSPLTYLAAEFLRVFKPRAKP